MRDKGKTKLIACPYHAWTYALDGQLIGAPHMGEVDGFEKGDYPLRPVSVAVWEGLIFINLADDPEPFDESFGPLMNKFSQWHLGELERVHQTVYEVEANWKLLIENYNECYHCTSIHPALCEVTPVNSGADLDPTGLWCGGTMELKPHAATMSLDGATPLPPLPGVTPNRLRQVVYVTLFPNLLISAHPDYVLVHRLTPLSPERTEIECAWLFPAETVSDASFDPAYAVDFWDITNREDWAVCEGVQRGMANTGYRQGPLSTGEATVYQFLPMVGRAYMGQGLTPSPAEERVLRE